MPPASLPWCRFTKRAFAVRHGTDGALQLTGYGAGAAHSAARGAAHSAQPQRTFREYNLHLEREQPEAHRIWILKPLGGFNQIGIHMYSLGKSDVASDEATAAWLFRRVPEGSWVLQEYAMNIMTYDGNKFDLRVWAAVTSLDPLRIYLLGTGIPKVPHARARAHSYAHAHAHARAHALAHARTHARASCPHALLLPPLRARALPPLLALADLAVEVLEGRRARQGAVHPRAAAGHERVLRLSLAAGQCTQPLPAEHVGRGVADAHEARRQAAVAARVGEYRGAAGRAHAAHPRGTPP